MARDEHGAGGTEGGRSPTGVTPARGKQVNETPAATVVPVVNSEVPEKPLRRTFTAAYKARILSETDACTQPGQVGAILRREGLYSSHLSAWRRQRDAGALSGLSPRQRGRKSRVSPLEKENQRLQGENEQLRERLRKAELIIEAQKKISALLTSPPLEQENGGNR